MRGRIAEGLQGTVSRISRSMDLLDFLGSQGSSGELPYKKSSERNAKAKTEPFYATPAVGTPQQEEMKTVSGHTAKGDAGRPGWTDARKWIRWISRLAQGQCSIH